MQKSVVRRFFSQHRTPIIPQVPVDAPLNAHERMVRVGYLLCRNQVVKHNPHPVETEFSFALEREHQRYCRHEGSESATHFLASRGQSMDALGRMEPGQIESNFYGLDLYQDAMKVVLQRFSPEKRLTSADFVDPTSEELVAGPPSRKTINRALDDFLFLIIKQKGSGKWTIPTTARRENESLRVALDRSILEHHGEAFDTYSWSNAPQGVVRSPAQVRTGATECLTFIYNTTYLSGRPRFDAMEAEDHAWVRRCEMPQYLGAERNGFASDDMLPVLMDIAVDGTFDGAAA